MQNADDQTKSHALKSWIRFILILIVLVFIFRYVINMTIVSGKSMSPTLHDNDIILTNNMFYELERNDIIVFRDQNGFNVIKRIIALPRDKVEIIDGAVYINSEKINENYTTGTSNDLAEITVDDNSYFVMGDNRSPGASLDSRDQEVGTIPEEDVTGKMLIRLYPIN